jgi:hypothetical protein
MSSKWRRCKFHDRHAYELASGAFLLEVRRRTISTEPRMKQKVALITGVTGQDGACLA